MQIQNLTRPAPQYEGWSAELLDHVAQAVTSGEIEPSEDLSELLLRATITASYGHTLVSCDYSSVEARALAWLARDEDALGVFVSSSGADPYKTAAAAIYGVPYSEVTKAQRQIGKIAELACGYGGGALAFDAFATSMGVDLSSVDVTRVVRRWRAARAPTAAYWRGLEKAFRGAVAGRKGWASYVEVCPADDGPHVAIYLPSGRPIIYRDVRREEDGSLSFHGTKAREYTYGGKLTENVVQAICRDVLADALVRAEAAGLRPVMHVHDEIVCEVPISAGPEALAELRQIMLTPPQWIAGFPPGAEGYVSMRYRK
jgi:DNA polymerase